ncbi:MAG: nucleotidyltransferase domain-containing protein [Chloroflexi bacterium]|jgi:predicted nucleotidyltransferase|uniref:Nucleotidyltransferase domain-containing protein n=1 Tax=Candidatus Thermofonsia Clade 3 bacterium TaxID=2364212 RepID=A0A2M8QCY7_9CHLR|nr:nucleotidyltransferase domain-containing protein [Candidatus Roseilinea sp. NK_OTU-006]PJF47667.1 MAG: nucleotidyltransferase domain-containing protein [Candidatus Thermofonsia Clade 3 bacterium]RMG63098.1 MAG: nucleotidyltransferase domain-containing protein [Chloroflexota bacterium]
MSPRARAASDSALDDLKRALADHLSSRPEIVFAMLYGSAAEGRPFRDVDVAVYVDESQLAGRDRYAYIFMLADVLEQCIPYPVDVRLINDAPLPFRYNISRGQPIFARDPAALADFLSRTWDEYLDFQPVAMKYLEYLRTAPRYADRG